MQRHEEKYLIDYRQYAILKSRALASLIPDSHGIDGSYWVTSLYYDDLMDTALLEKQDGLSRHTKFRLRTYDGKNDVIRLERKIKEGILTQKQSASVTVEQLPLLGLPNWDMTCFDGAAYDLVAQMQARALRPAVTVRYRRDAFLYQGTDIRLTFDTDMETLQHTEENLFNLDAPGIPVLDKNTVVMEIKYGKYIPGFIRQLTADATRQLSVSKYALCREKII